MPMAPLATPPPIDADLAEACGERPGAFCEAVWNRTENEALATVVDWFIGRPLRVVLIVLVAWVLARLARRIIRRTIHRIVVTDREAAGRALQRVGVPTRALKVGEKDPRREGRAESIGSVTSSSVAVLIGVIAGFLVLGELGINLAPLLASAGIAGVALGFGAQSLVKDCITGLFMLIEDQYGIGDVVDLGGADGVVERITLRTTVLRGADGTVWHVPNGEILRVGNRSQQWALATVDAVVAASADVAAARRVAGDAARQLCTDEGYAGDIIEAPEMLGVESVTPEAITLRINVKTKPGAQFRLQRALRESVKDALDDAGIPAPPLPRSPWSRGGADGPA